MVKLINIDTRSRRKDGFLTTGDMARLSQNTLRTVRFYEEAGLLHPVQRTEGGHRLFPSAELRKLMLISDLRGAGFSLEEIRETLETKDRSAKPADAAREIIAKLDSQVTTMRERLELLERLLVELSAAKEVLAKCAACPNETHNHNCGECPHMPAEIPNAVSVLWQMEH